MVTGCKCPRFCLDRNTKPASIPTATVWTCPNNKWLPKCHMIAPSLRKLCCGPSKRGFLRQLLIKRENAHYFFKLCSFSKSPVLFVLHNPEHTASKRSMSLQATGTRETSLWNHQKLKKYVCNILLQSVAPCAANPTQSGQEVPGAV